MFSKPKYLKWIKFEKDVFVNKNITVHCYVLSYDLTDDKTIMDWARHIRRHYIIDKEMNGFIPGSEERKNYLKYIIPPGNTKQSKALRSGDFGEILTSDIREYFYNECVFRGKQNGKATANQPVTGSDVVSCKILDIDNYSVNDELYITEVKSVVSKKDYGVLLNACNDSAKDKLRIAETLVFFKRKYDSFNYKNLSKAVNRFFMKAEIPCKEFYQGSGITIDSTLDDSEIISLLNCSGEVSELLFIRGQKLNSLVSVLYERALLC